MNGVVVCNYVITCCYTDKPPITIGCFTIERQKTEQETEAAALSTAASAIKRFFDKYFPSGTVEPNVIDVKLGSMTFVPDDYEWRRV
jgi:hypothetical protein